MNKQEKNNHLKQAFNNAIANNELFMSEFHDLKTCLKIRTNNNETLRESMSIKHDRQKYFKSLMARNLNNHCVTSEWFKPISTSQKGKKIKARLPKKLQSLTYKNECLHICYNNTYTHILPLYAHRFNEKLLKHAKHITKYARKNALPYDVYNMLNIQAPRFRPINTNQYSENVMR